jgi:hypothetical protein
MKSVRRTRPHDWEGDSPLARPLAETVIYELHVGAFTQHPNSGVAPEKRGTYAGLVEKIPYLQDLGVTAVELLPVFQFDPQAAPAGRVNYWGYQPVSFFAPHHAYRSRPAPLGVLDDFRDMVKALHRAGIEVILDVVFNHTAEGDADGPTLSFRGLANDFYYTLDRDQARYADFSGCGNTLNTNNWIVRRLIEDSLRYWVAEMHVDGFRFDLASILSRDETGTPMPNPPIVWDLDSDPLLAGTKLIAEPWDAGGLYQVGHFAGDRWQEWNGRFRDDVRRFVKGDDNSVPAIAARILGSPDVYGHKEREPEQSINFVTCHDGFTLTTTWSYGHKQRGQRRGQSRRCGRQPELELWHRRGDRRSRDRIAAESPGQELHRAHVARGRDADAAHGRRGAPDPARQQQRLLPGRPRRLVRLEFAGAPRRRPPLRQAPQRVPPAARRRRRLRADAQRAAPARPDRVARRRARPSGLEPALAFDCVHAGNGARPIPPARDVQRLLGTVDVRAAADPRRSRARLAALPRHVPPLTARHSTLAGRAGRHGTGLHGAAAVGGGAGHGTRAGYDEGLRRAS